MKKVGYESAEAAARTAWLRRQGSASLTGTAHLSSSGVLWAGSRLYRCHILLFHTCWKTLLEVFRICMLLLRSGLSFYFKILCNIVHLIFFQNFAAFCVSVAQPWFFSLRPQYFYTNYRKHYLSIIPNCISKFLSDFAFPLPHLVTFLV